MSSLIRILKTTQVTPAHTITVDETLTDAGGAVTVTVKRLDGTVVTSGTATHGTVGVYSFVLPPSAVVDTWTVDWSGSVAGVTIVVRDYVEIVGDFLFGLPDVRTDMSIPASVTAAKMAAVRIEVEQTCEKICRKAWVLRFARYLLDGSGTTDLIVPNMYVRTVRAASIADRYGQTLTVLDAGSLAAVAPLPEGVLARDDGGIWPAGRRNVLVEYEHGADMPPEEVRTAAKLHFRSVIGRTKSGVPDRATSFTMPDGSTYRITLPGASTTGIPDVDAAYARNGEPKVWVA
jgi:hypothetical protein